MLDEKRNDHFHWKNKLEGLDSLPGEMLLEKNTAWEKLHGRLQQKPRKNRAIWYWAAACILAALVIPFMLTNKKEDTLVKELPQQKKNMAQPSLPEQLPVKETNTVVVAAPGKTNKTVTATMKKQETITLNNTVKEDDPIVSTATLPVETKNESIFNSLPPVDTVAAITAAAPARKKLQVVHINELVASPAPVALPHYVQKSLKIKFGNNRAATQTVASQQQGTGGFKINFSPKN